MYTDPIADLLTRIRNAANANLGELTIPYSKVKENILKVMKGYGFIENYITEEFKGKKNLKVELKEDRKDLVLKRVSKPGQRIYKKNSDLKTFKSGLGIRILSTSKGIMSNVEAKKQNLGGEVICELF